MRKKRQRKNNRVERTSICSPEIENLFNLVSQEKIEELTNYILSEDNQVWNMKKGEGITILHNACVLENEKIVQTIIEQTKKRLQLISDDSLSYLKVPLSHQDNPHNPYNIHEEPCSRLPLRNYYLQEDNSYQVFPVIYRM